MDAMSARIAFLLFACCVQATAFAAPSLLPGSQQLIRERQQQLLEQQNQRIEELQNLPAAPAATQAAPVPESTRCFAVQRIQLHGITLLSPAEQATLVEPFSNQCLGVGQLNALLKAITDVYLERGYVTTRAYLPQQDLADGVLDIRVVEGRLESL